MRWTPIDELARATTELAARHDAVATVLGEAARAGTPPTEAAARLAAHAAQHAWHAELWRARRPAVDALADAPVIGDRSEDDPAAAYATTIPGLVADVSRLRDATDERVDAPTARVADLVLADLRAQMSAGDPG